MNKVYCYNCEKLVEGIIEENWITALVAHAKLKCKGEIVTCADCGDRIYIVSSTTNLETK